MIKAIFDKNLVNGIEKSQFARFWMVLSAIVIFAIGLIMIYSTTSAEILDQNRDHGEHTQLIKQLGYALCGLLLALGMINLGWKNFLAISPYLMGLVTGLLILTLIPGIGREVNGSKRWLFVAGFSFQPSEFAKLIIPTYFLYYYLKYDEKSLSLQIFLKLVARTLIPILLIMIEPNNGTAMVILLALLVVFFLSEVPFKYWAWPLLIMLLIGGTFISQLPYVKKRLKVYIDPESDLRGKGHQPYQAKIAVGSGGFWEKVQQKVCRSSHTFQKLKTTTLQRSLQKNLVFLGFYF